MTFLKKFLKWIFVGAAIVLVLLIALGFYLRECAKMDSSYDDSHHIQNMEVLERSGRHDELVEYVITLMTTADQNEAKNIARWFNSQRSNGAAPYLYFRVLFLAKAGKKNETFEAYELAKLVARLDEVRCNNDESKDAKTEYESGLWFPFELAKSGRHATHKKADRVWAYNYEKEIENRPLAEWVCTNNYKLDYDASDALSNDEWKEMRSDYLAKYLLGELK